MPQFSSSDEFYTISRALFDRMLAEKRLDHVGGRLRIRIGLTQPSAELLINTRPSPPQVTYGPAAGPFDLEVSMAGDTLHALWTDQLGVREALGKGLIKVKGSPLKALSLKHVFDHAKVVYPAILASHQRTA